MVYYIKGELHLKPKLSMLGCVWVCVCVCVAVCVFNQYLHDSRNTWSTEILRPFLSFSDIWLQDIYVTFQKSVYHLEIAHETC